jgi:succinate-acetate transporter protein
MAAATPLIDCFTDTPAVMWLRLLMVNTMARRRVPRLGSFAACGGALHGAGWAEIVLAAVAFYIVLAELANETLQRPLFPLFPLHLAARPAVQPA